MHTMSSNFSIVSSCTFPFIVPIRAILDHRFHTIDCSEEADITPRMWDFVEELFDEPAMDVRRQVMHG